MVKVQALTIDGSEIMYRCPYKCAIKYHKHSSHCQLHNRVELRCSHCEKEKNEVEIEINDYTMRAIVYKTFKSNDKLEILPLPKKCIKRHS